MGGLSDQEQAFRSGGAYPSAKGLKLTLMCGPVRLLLPPFFENRSPLAPRLPGR